MVLTASFGVLSCMNMTRDMSLERGWSDDDDDDDDDDDAWGRCHILTVLSAAAVMKPPRGNSGYVAADE